MELGHLGDCIPFKFELVVEGLKLNFESLSMTVWGYELKCTIIIFLTVLLIFQAFSYSGIGKLPGKLISKAMKASWPN